MRRVIAYRRYFDAFAISDSGTVVRMRGDRVFYSFSIV